MRPRPTTPRSKASRRNHLSPSQHAGRPIVRPRRHVRSTRLARHTPGRVDPRRASPSREEEQPRSSSDAYPATEVSPAMATIVEPRPRWAPSLSLEVQLRRRRLGPPSWSAMVSGIALVGLTTCLPACASSFRFDRCSAQLVGKALTEVEEWDAVCVFPNGTYEARKKTFHLESWIGTFLTLGVVSQWSVYKYATITELPGTAWQESNF